MMVEFIPSNCLVQADMREPSTLLSCTLTRFFLCAGAVAHALAIMLVNGVYVVLGNLCVCFC